MPALEHVDSGNNAPDAAEPLPFGNLDDFREYCEIEAFMYAHGWVPWHHAIDTVQWIAERWRLIDAIGQDAVQAVMVEVFGRFHSPIEPEEIPLAPEPPAGGYRTARSTEDAFWHVARTETAERIADWLARHPRDAAYLHQLWKAKQCSTAAA